MSGMLGRRNDGGFDTTKFQNGKPATRKRLFRKIRQQITIEQAELRRRRIEREQKTRRKDHVSDKKQFSANLAAGAAKATAGGAVIRQDGEVTAIRGVGENMTPLVLNKMWLSWDGEIDA